MNPNLLDWLILSEVIVYATGLRALRASVAEILLPVLVSSRFRGVMSLLNRRSEVVMAASEIHMPRKKMRFPHYLFYTYREDNRCDSTSRR